MENKISGVGYVRYSSNNQREESIDAQKRKITEYCDNNNIKLLKFYEDKAKSGTNTKKRNAFLKMIEDSEHKNFECVLVHKLDRFSRNRLDSLTFEKRLKANGVQLISVSENIDGSPASIMMESVIGGMSEYYVANLANEVMKGMTQNALSCKHTGGVPPLGFNINPETKLLEINTEEAETVKLIFNLFDLRYSYKKIIKILNDKKYKTKFGNKFNKNSLHDILKNEKYNGVYVFNKKSSKDMFGKRNNHSFKNDNEIIRIKDGCPKIIDDDLFNRVQERMEENKHNAGQFKAKENYILHGKIFCGECNSNMTGSRRSSGNGRKIYVTYRCSGKLKENGCSNREINKTYVENFVLRQLKLLLFGKKRMSKLVVDINEYINNEHNGFTDKIKEFKIQINGIDRKINNIITAVENGNSNAMLQGRLDSLTKNKQHLLDEIENLEFQKKSPKITKDEIKDSLKKFRTAVVKNDAPEAKKVIRDYVEKVIVYNDRIEVFIKVARNVSNKYKFAV